jgi:hypothetical protein
MLDSLAQWMIVILGPTAVWVVGWKGPRRRWGYIIGAACQPFWFITLYENRQWPVFIVAFFYTYSWVMGVWNHWIRKESCDG